jgi:predicted metal-binding membrane protein
VLAPRVDDQRPFRLVLGALIVLAWAALWLWATSPYGRYLSHEGLADGRPDARPEYLLLVGIFVGGWVLMTVAMMLPTSLPLVVLFKRLVRDRPDAPWLVALLLLGYLALWTVFGVLTHALDLAIHEGVRRSGWLGANTWLLSAAPLLLAGVYQFTRLKYACLKRCRSPLSFITEHWHGQRSHIEALTLGLHHAVFCIGCCWSLMLLMFSIGVGNVAWMLILGVVMAVEKNAPWGRRLSSPLGIALLTWGSLVVIQHVLR